MEIPHRMLVAYLDVIDRLKKDFPEWANTPQLWVKARYPRPATYRYSYATGESIEVKLAEPTPWKAAHADVVDALRRMRGRVSAARVQRQQVAPYSPLMADMEATAAELRGALAEWRGRPTWIAEVKPWRGTVERVTTDYGTVRNVVTARPMWAHRVKQHLQGDPVVDDRFVLDMRPARDPAFDVSMLEATVIEPEGRDGFHLRQVYIVNEGRRQFFSLGDTPKAAYGRYRKRLIAASKARFAA